MPLFYMDLILNGFEAVKSITRGIGRGGPLKSRLYGPNGTRFTCLDFRGPPLSKPLGMDLARLKTITAPYKQQVHL